MFRIIGSFSRCLRGAKRQCRMLFRASHALLGQDLWNLNGPGCGRGGGTRLGRPVNGLFPAVPPAPIISKKTPKPISATI
jgi:hypothetical protein